MRQSTIVLFGDLHFHYVLSMGAIYALLAAFYYWIGKITGYQYNEKWGLIHFVVFTVAINIVFQPMHFLGISGMPRRIPDYADAYSGFNSIMTIGSFLTVISIFIFLYIVAYTVFNPKVLTPDASYRARWSMI